ncbi:hypothetical protein N9153_02290, partial [Planctomicrobium sp.]|nr:hypothetical protein [Planctomicrobium sp.]
VEVCSKQIVHQGYEANNKANFPLTTPIATLNFRSGRATQFKLELQLDVPPDRWGLFRKQLRSSIHHYWKALSKTVRAQVHQ